VLNRSPLESARPFAKELQINTAAAPALYLFTQQATRATCFRSIQAQQALNLWVVIRSRLGRGHCPVLLLAQTPCQCLSSCCFNSDTSFRTVASCVAKCQTGGFAYAGLEYGRECYCGDALASGSVVASPASDPSAAGCSMTCSGNNREYCGGPSRLNLCASWKDALTF
jgi:hypothetical protein